MTTANRSSVLVLRVDANRAAALLLGAATIAGTLVTSTAAQSTPASVPPPGELAEADGDSPVIERLGSIYERPDDDSFTPGAGPDATLTELDEIDLHWRGGMFDPGIFGRPFDAAHDLTANIERETGLRFAMAYTMVFQRASGGPGTRNGGSGDLDFMTSWALLGRDTPNVGRLVFTGEYRHTIGQQPASALGRTIGVLTNTTGGFNDRGWAIRDFFWMQGLADGKLRLLLGRYDASDYVGSNPLQSINNSFSNRALSANATVGFPNGHALGAGASIRPTDELYVTFGASNAYGLSTQAQVSSFFDEFDLFYTAEIGFTPMIDGVGRGRYAVTGWYTDDTPLRGLESDQGVSAILQQEFGDRLLAFVRYSYADGVLSGIRHQVSGAVGVSGLLGYAQNMTGLGASWADPRDGSRDDEKVIEAFHRFQLTRFTQLSFGIQGIFDPADSDSDAIAVFTGRLRVAF